MSAIPIPPIPVASNPTMTCVQEDNKARFRVGYPVKDSQGNAIDQPEGIELRVQYPGTTEFVTVGSVDLPGDEIVWDLTGVPDGQYVGVAVGFLYKVHCNGCGSCKRYGPASPKFLIPVKEARPGAPPTPIQLTGCCPQAA